MAGGGFPLQPILDAVRAEGYPSQAPPSTWAASLQASESLWRSAGLVDVQTRQIEVHRSFDSFDDFWRTAYGSHRLRDLFTSLSSAALQRLNDRVREGLGFVSDGPLVLQARANAVKGRKHCRAHRPLSLARAPAQGNRCGPAADGRNLPVKTAIGRTPHRRLVADSGCTRGVAALPTRSTASFLALGQVDDGPAPTQSRQTPAAV
jgi:hypothetical protein